MEYVLPFRFIVEFIVSYVTGPFLMCGDIEDALTRYVSV